MKLYFMRHGEAVEKNDFFGSDKERPLTQKGRADVRELAFILTTQGVKADKIFTSTAKRAIETAWIVKSECGWEIPIDECNVLGLETSDEAVIRFIISLPVNCDYLLVGHEPTLGNVMRMLIGDKYKNLLPKVTPGTVFHIIINNPANLGSGTLKWQIPTSGPFIA